MELIFGILFYLGAVTSPGEVTDQVIQDNRNEITQVMNDPDAMAVVDDIVGLTLLFPPDKK